MLEIESIILSLLVGFGVGIIVMVIAGQLGISRANSVAKNMIEESKLNAEHIIRQAKLEGKQEVYDLKLQAEKEIKQSRSALQVIENKLMRREDTLNLRDETLISKEKQVEDRNRQLTNKLANLEKLEEELQQKIDNQMAVLESVSQLSVEDAKKQLMDLVEHKCEKEIAVYLRDAHEEAAEKAKQTAQNLIALAIQANANEEVMERTISIVTLPNEEMKGRVIGKEGRNIHAFEQLTGVDLIIDDTPDIITLSCFDPIRREIAKIALELLLKDGRIQPGRIEEVVEKVRNDMDKQIMKIGDDTIFKLGIGKMDKELVRLVGRLRFRYSYGQNALQHSVEVAHFAGIMAAELGLNQTLAKRAGLLHDIGKALDFEQEGTHIELGARVAKKCKENPVVINAIESHHGDTEPTSVIAQLVIAADTLSAARPGARNESLAGYIKRLEALEEIVNSFEGVQKTYAIKSGKEIRVMVQPEKIDDIRMIKIASDIKEKIENELTYPGQIKITLIRETRASEIAK